MTKQYQPGRVNPQKFGLWISMGSLIMMFMAFTSAYIVRHAAGNWLEFAIPNVFVISTIVIILSSITLQASYYCFNNEQKRLYRGLLVVTFFLGLAIIAMIHAFTLKFNVTEKRKNRFQLVLQFWHFLGFLWIYLYSFLLFFR